MASYADRRNPALGRLTSLAHRKRLPVSLPWDVPGPYETGLASHRNGTGFMFGTQGIDMAPLEHASIS